MRVELDAGRRAEIRERAVRALLELPAQVGRYLIRGELGRGGMGVVYDAFDPQLSRRVALKVIDPDRLDDATSGGDGELHQRFEREMKATSRLFHPNLVTILDAGSTRVAGEDRAYYVMECIEGESLEQRLDRAGPVSRVEVLEIGVAIARGLAEVHQQGLVHRDVKPSNILLPLRGEPKLTDFGLCHWRRDPLHQGAGQGEGESLLGSAHYLSPEQVQGAGVDSRADLFSFGGVLIRCATGKLPFSAPSLGDLLRKIVAQPPDGLEDLSPDLRALIADLMAKDRDARPGSTEAVVTRLTLLASRAPVARRWARRLRVMASTLVLIGALATAFGSWVRHELSSVQVQAARHEHADAPTAPDDTRRRAAPFPAGLPVAGAEGAEGAEGAGGAGPADRLARRDLLFGALNRLEVVRRRHGEAQASANAWLPSSLGRATLVHDPEQWLGALEARELAVQLGLFARELSVDARMLVVSPQAATLEEFASLAFESLEGGSLGPGKPEPGAGLGPRGLLLVVDPLRGRARIELGYALETHLPDSLVGSLLRDHVARLAGPERGLSLRLALRVLRGRLRRAALAGPLVMVDGVDAAVGFGAGGGGASAALGDWVPPSRTRLSPASRAAFSPAPTVHEAYARYRAWLVSGGLDPDVELFTPETRKLLCSWRGTPSYAASMIDRLASGPVEVRERGDAALLFATRDPLALPHLFRRAPAGWQVDLAAEQRHLRMIAGGAHTWTLRNVDAEPIASFRDELEVVDGLVRLREGDNRRLHLGVDQADAS